ncbi:LxmA leader domain family RiPP [Streptomyces lavendulocolor]|uniref:LxmA leader domain family RiPP n=1 Tax=Streptomyces lavendulocolor TaxID=67316 RepID=UPI0031D11DBA
MNTTDQLISGYAAYATAEEVGAGQMAGAPEASPVALSATVVITEGSYALSAGISMSVGVTFGKGC